ncbi:MAG: hypothetical protein ABI779_28250 [Acidobacteriota bacterium]
MSRAAEDIQYRERLLADPEALLEETGFSEAEREVVGSLRRVALEEWGVDVRRFRAFLRDNGNKLTPS